MYLEYAVKHRIAEQWNHFDWPENQIAVNACRTAIQRCQTLGKSCRRPQWLQS